MRNKLCILICICFTSSLFAQTVYKGVFKTPLDNLDYHHFIRKSDEFAATYINQVSTTGDILALSSGIATANRNIKFLVKNNGALQIGELGGNHDIQVRRSGSQGNVTLLLEADSDDKNENSNPAIKLLQDGKKVGAKIGFSNTEFGANMFGISTQYTGTYHYDTFIINPVNGYIGIGTKSPDSRLSVKGKIHTQELVIDLKGAVVPDYVFTPEYPLKSLHTVEEYINKNGHLPNVPSAKEIQANGLDVKNMNLKLLEKIEELTLYVIALHKKNKELEYQLQQLKN